MNYPFISSMSESEYRSAEGVNNSSLKLFDASPVKFKLGTTREQTPALRSGVIFHSLLLRPEIFESVVAVRPESFKDWRTDASKVWKAEQEQAGKVVVTAKELSDAMAMAKALRDNADTGPFMQSGLAEQAIFVKDEITGLIKKGMVDWLPDESIIENGVVPICDIKTTESSRADEFEKSARRYSYRRQAAYYIDLCKEAGMDRPSFMFFAIEKEPPFEIGVFLLSNRSIEVGRQENLDSLLRYKQCLDSGVWESRTSGISIIEA